METEGKKMFNYKEAEAKRKKFSRYKEGCEIYSMGITKFQEIAKLAGVVYKINEGTGGNVLISLDIFDDYMEQFRESLVPMKNPLWKESET